MEFFLHGRQSSYFINIVGPRCAKTCCVCGQSDQGLNCPVT